MVKIKSNGKCSDSTAQFTHWTKEQQKLSVEQPPKAQHGHNSLISTTAAHKNQEDLTMCVIYKLTGKVGAKSLYHSLTRASPTSHQSQSLNQPAQAPLWETCRERRGGKSASRNKSN